MKIPNDYFANTSRKALTYRGLAKRKLSAVARQLNERPRKTLQYQTPAEKFDACVAATS